MSTDCNKLSQNAREIFEKITVYFPPDPWKKPQWKKTGVVYANGWVDLRTSEGRRKLIIFYTALIGNTITLSAKKEIEKGRKLTRSIFDVEACTSWIELVYHLEELDFQIETMDLVEETN